MRVGAWSMACVLRQQIEYYYSLTQTSSSTSSLSSQVYVYLVLCGAVNGVYYSILYTLSVPVLSDRFGFSVKHTAYFFNGVASVQLASAFCVYVNMSVYTDILCASFSLL